MNERPPQSVVFFFNVGSRLGQAALFIGFSNRLLRHDGLRPMQTDRSAVAAKGILSLNGALVLFAAAMSCS